MTDHLYDMYIAELKAEGVIENTPREFRDALDNYFHGIEAIKN